MPKYQIGLSQSFSTFLEKIYTLEADDKEKAITKANVLFKKAIEASNLLLDAADTLPEIDCEELNYCEDAEFIYPYDSYNQFVSDMKDAGLELRQYGGRYGYNGPGVSCDSINDVTSKTSVKCQWDNLGMGWIVYPR